MTRGAVHLVGAGLLALAAGSRVGAQELAQTGVARPHRTAVALSASDRVELDGRLDEPMWALPSPASDFVQQQPDEGRPATLRTEVRFLYDLNTLYVGAMLFDDEPGRLVINELKRDFVEANNDLFGVVIDTFRDGRTAYGFVVNPGGAQRETQAYDQGERDDSSWNAVWQARTRILENGWSVEMAIPLSALRFPQAPEQHWGLNLVRVIRRRNETATWSAVPRQFTQYHVGYAGVLEGMTGIRGGRQLRLTPFATSQTTSTAIEGSGVSKGEVGGDLKWAITPSLVLDGTYNTDFAQVEADQVQINLTRFSILFPEKRQFFLESPGSFQIGLTGEDSGISGNMLLPFFTRRIGLSDDNRPVPVVGGARLTGQSAGTTIGFLNMQTGRAGARPGDNFTALRLARPAGGAASIGGFYFGREATGTAAPGQGYNRVFGGDLRYAPRRTFAMDAVVMRSESDGPEDDWAVRLGMRLRANRQRGRLSYLYVGDQFRHDLGYVRRRDASMLFGDYSTFFRPRATSEHVREYELKMEVHVAQDARMTQTETRQLRPSAVVQFADGGVFRATLEDSFERLYEPFRLRRAVTIPPGDYHFGEGVLYYETSRARPLSLLLHGNYGTFWNGDRRRARAGFRWRVNSHFAASAEYDRNHIELPEGRFTEGLAVIRLDSSLTTRMFLNAFVQYNGRDDVWLTNVRFNFIHRPLSDIYVVWNDATGTGIRDRAFIVKYSHSFAF
ncbi:MAG: carbohydrate binding family 9 domain-containing protein [Acidobacteria bacterium]|nr:carbohydrate binding family 9 domain-containing protein [Acidobacteriota bacterium]